MKNWLLLSLIVFLAGCAPKPAPHARAGDIPPTQTASHRGELVDGAPSAMPDGRDVRIIQEARSIAGRYYTPNGGTVEIDGAGQVKAEGVLGSPHMEGTLAAQPSGMQVAWTDGRKARVSRLWLGLQMEEETLLRQDGRVMFNLAPDPGLSGRFSSATTTITSRDGRIFDHARLVDGQWQIRRYVHTGQWINGEAMLRWLDETHLEPEVAVARVDGALRLGGEVFQAVDDGPAGIQGDFKDTLGNHLMLRDGEAVFSLSFPGKAHAVQAKGRLWPVAPGIGLIDSDETPAAFTLTVRQLAMGHVIVSLPASAGTPPLVLMAPLARRLDPPTRAPLGLYLNADAYDITLLPQDKIHLVRKMAAAHAGTPGAIQRTVIGAELFHQGVAKVYYDQGDPMVALFEDHNGQMDFYPTDYRQHAVYLAERGYVHRMRLDHPQDGLHHKEVPTLLLEDTALRHYQSAYDDLVADAFEAQERKKDEELADALQQDGQAPLALEDAQAERERRMRRREDGRNAGDPTPDVGEFFVSKHPQRVSQMLELRRQLANLPQPRNAAELRANMATEKRIRTQAAKIEQEELNDTGAP